MEIAFMHPWTLLFILFLPIVVILHYYFFEHNKRKAMKFANFTAMKRVTGTHLITKNNSQLALRIAVLFFIIISASEPVLWREGDVSASDYVLAIDTSASMVADDVQPDRITVAKQTAESFIEESDRANIGIIGFSGVSFIKSKITDDEQVLKQAINSLDIQLSGGTDIGAALVTGTNMLVGSEKSKTIILLTDGSDTAGSFIDESVQTGLQYVTDNHITVHTIGIGSGLGNAGYVDEALQAAYNTDTLETIARRTGGKSYSAQNSAELRTAFRDIQSTTETAMVSTRMRGFFLMVAVLLLIVEWGLLNTRFRAIP